MRGGLGRVWRLFKEGRGILGGVGGAWGILGHYWAFFGVCVWGGGYGAFGGELRFLWGGQLRFFRVMFGYFGGGREVGGFEGGRGGRFG